MNACEKVEKIGGKYVGEQKQVDTYFSHPTRDFKKTDEALRLRVSDGMYITYKGPKKCQDAKVREEIEFPVPADAEILLAKLGFKVHHIIKKIRHTYEYDGCTICCDQVEGLGEYVEVEILNSNDYKKIRKILVLLDVADAATTKSYSELLCH